MVDRAEGGGGTHTSERIDRNEHMGDICLCVNKRIKWGFLATHIDLLVDESLFQILVDLLVRDRRQEGHVRYTCRLLLPEPFRPIGLMSVLLRPNAECLRANRQ